MKAQCRNLLIIDDDKLFCDSVAAYFHGKSLQVSSAYTGEQAINWLKENTAEVVLLDQQLPDCRGTELCDRLLQLNDRSKIIFITAFPSFDHAVSALRNGAHDYISKPMELEELRLTVEMALRTVELEQVEQVQKYRSQQDWQTNTLLGLDGGLSSIRELVQRAAASRSPVLLTGETGTGKTVVAKTIHYHGPYGQQPFIDTNCAALPENLIEAELFGHERGAFTGAETRKKGLFEMADGGTLFLDEIGEMDIHLQAKLLGVLDSGTFRRLGGQTVHTSKVRVIAATNIDLEEAISAKTFREDLHYRLSVMRIHLPPLRQRKEDIGLLVNHFLATLSPDKHTTLADGEIKRLMDYSWPGNVRELRNIIERTILLADSSKLYPSRLLRKEKGAQTAPLPPITSPESVTPLTLEELEKQYIRHILSYHHQNRSQAAATLGIARSTLLRKIDLYRLG